MNTRSCWPELGWRAAHGRGELLPLTVVPSHFSLVFVKRCRRSSVHFSRFVPDTHVFPLCQSIAAIAAWRFDADEVVEIEIDNGL
jgi:hypothetical protein